MYKQIKTIYHFFQPCHYSKVVLYIPHNRKLNFSFNITQKEKISMQKHQLQFKLFLLC